MNSDNLEPAGRVPEWLYRADLRAPGTDDEPAPLTARDRFWAGWCAGVLTAAVVIAAARLLL